MIMYIPYDRSIIFKDITKIEKGLWPHLLPKELICMIRDIILEQRRATPMQ